MRSNSENLVDLVETFPPPSHTRSNGYAGNVTHFYFSMLLITDSDSAILQLTSTYNHPLLSLTHSLPKRAVKRLIESFLLAAIMMQVYAATRNKARRHLENWKLLNVLFLPFLTCGKPKRYTLRK